MLYFWAGVIYSWSSWYMFLEAPMAWTYAFLNMCELESFHESYSSGILPDKISALQLHQTREVNERLYIKEVGVDLELVFMPMDTMYILS